MNNKIVSYNVCFLGETGHGKSSLINALWGTKLSTDPLVPCTKELTTICKLEEGFGIYNAVRFFDTPGVGEFSTNSPYQLMYNYAVSQAHCVVLVTNFSRADAKRQRLLDSLRPYISTTHKTRFIIALSHIDSMEGAPHTDYKPWDEKRNIPSEECLARIALRTDVIHQKYDGLFLPFEVVPVCAPKGYGIDILKQHIYNKI